MLVAELGAGPDDVGRAGQLRELLGAGDVVVVEMGLDDGGDPDVGFAGGVEVDVDVASGSTTAATPLDSSAMSVDRCPRPLTTTWRISMAASLSPVRDGPIVIRRVRSPSRRGPWIVLGPRAFKPGLGACPG